MRSMTGYGQASVEGAGWRLEVTCRGVNHRFLDVAVRMPDLCRRSEGAVQALVGERLARGRLEVNVEASPLEEAPGELRVRSDVARRLAEAAAELSADRLGRGELGVADLLRFPGIVELRSGPMVWGKAEEALLLDAVEAALGQLLAAGGEEGRRLRHLVLEKLRGLESVASELERRRPEAQAALVTALETRLDELLGERPIEPERRAQEAALLAEKTNIAEELERLQMHLEHFRQILDEGGALGKRLDFLVQEIFRELNTLSTKCRDATMSRLSVDGKVLCEELREQLRNVE